mgnify:CR=1 FL=1
MKTSSPVKKIWVKPEVHALSIKKDTFSGSQLGKESPQDNTGAYVKKV